MSKQDFKATPETARIHYGEVAGPPSASPETERAAAVAEAGESPEVTARPVPVAVMVCHGMGEQVRFETIGQLAAAILKEARAEGCTAVDTGVELSFQNESFLARAELNWIKPDGNEHSVHIYEAYWAPVTEGKVTYWDTVCFLSEAAWAGFKSSRFFRTCTFERYLFGGMKSLTVYKRTKLALLALIVVLTLQVALIGKVMAKLADQLKHIDTAHFSLWQIAGVFFPGFFPWHGQSLGHDLAALIGWYLLVAEVFIVRYFLIEFAGDVAAYISPYKASKFDDIRTRIQSIGLNVAKVIYGFGNTTVVPEYQRVIFAGHSLGSVLAYDTLNAAINLDATSAMPGARKVVDRTTKLITFGSPLDKTAFLFRNQSNHVKDPLREQMASAFQPLILDYADPAVLPDPRRKPIRRPDFWTNIYSGMDIISGALEYYDDPAVKPMDPLHVRNIADPDANIPFYAHVQYWTKPLLAKTLYDAVK
ncbi:MAG TPA: hypothetical protein VGD64_10510 [Acidisarcina sp.]